MVSIFGSEEQSAGRACHLAAPGSWSQMTALREHGKATGAVHRPRASASKYRLHVLVASASSLTATAALSRLTAGTTQTVAANATPTATTRAGGPRTKTRSMASAVMATCVYQGLKQSTPYARKSLALSAALSTSLGSAFPHGHGPWHGSRCDSPVAYGVDGNFLQHGSFVRIRAGR